MFEPTGLRLRAHIELGASEATAIEDLLYGQSVAHPPERKIQISSRVQGCGCTPRSHLRLHGRWGYALEPTLNFWASVAR